MTSDLTCTACHLRFDSTSVLSLHREKFCLAERPSLLNNAAQSVAACNPGRRETRPARGNKLGEMTLAEVKEQLQTNMARLDQLRGGRSQSEAHKKIRQLRELKARHLHMSRNPNALEKTLAQDLHQIQTDHQSDLQVSAAREQAYHALRTLNRGDLRSIEDKKRQELELLSDEARFLEQQETKILEDIDKLQKGLLQPKRAGGYNHSNTAATRPQTSTQKGEENSRLQLDERQNHLADRMEKMQQLALEQGKQLAELEVQRKQLEQQQAGIRGQLPPDSQLPSVRTGKRLQTPFFDKLRHEKIQGEARLRELKQRICEEEEREQKAIQATVDGFELERPLSSLSSVQLEVPKTVDMRSHQLDDSNSMDADSTFGDESLMTAIRELRKTYLRGGGKDVKLLHKISQLEKRAHQERHSVQQPQLQQMMPTATLPVADMQSQQTWHLIQQVQAQNAKLIEEVNQKRPDDHTLHLLDFEQQKELMKMKYETEMARQRAELVRIDLEMKRDYERLRPLEGRPQLSLQHQHPALVDPLHSSHYDPRGGFAIFWDFVLGLSEVYSHVNLMTAVYSKPKKKSHRRGLPSAHCRAPVQPVPIPGIVAVMALKQSFPGFLASVEHAVVVELQASVGESSRRNSSGRRKAIGWTKIGLFDQYNQVLSGRWKLPIRTSPIDEDKSLDQLNHLPQVGQVELYFRTVNTRDVDLQSKVRMEPHLHYSMYKYPTPPVTVTIASQFGYPESVGTATLLPSRQSQRVDTRPSSAIESAPSTPQAGEDHSRSGSQGEVIETVGFQVERVRGVFPGIAVLKLKGYKANGKPAVTLSGELMWESRPVKSNFLAGIHEFGHEKGSFDQVVLHRDMVVMVELWIGRRVRQQLGEDGSETEKADENEAVSETKLDDYEKDLEEETDSGDLEKMKRRGVKIIYEELKLVCWSAFRLVKVNETDHEEEESAGRKLVVDDGFHRLPLFKAEEMPNPEDLVLPIPGSTDEPYGRLEDATVELRVYSDVMPRPTSPLSEILEFRPTSSPYEAWIPHRRPNPSSSPFYPGDGIDLYIDGARFLPDIVTATRVSGRIFNHKYIKVGSKVDISTDIDLDSSVYDPRYIYCLKIREERLPPTSTILLKMYTRCRRTRELAIVGYSVLNVFVASGTDQQPATDSSAIPISLNEGGHQIRIKQHLPKLSSIMNASLLDDISAVPCASLLVRLVHIPRDGGLSHGSLTDEQGQSIPTPDYADGVYDSMQCKPSEDESRLFADMMTRQVLSVRNSMSLFGDGIEKRLRDDNGRRQWIAKRLWRLQEDNPLEVDLTYLSRYKPSCGIQFALDSAQNLPWSKLTQCVFCFAPPASFYSGHTDDHVRCTKSINWSSHQKCPEWRDGFHYFGRRRVHRHLVVVVHLLALDTGRRGRLKVTDEAWSAVQVFSDGYVCTSRYQLPLYEGRPNKVVFDYLRHYPVTTALRDLVGQRKIRLLDGASAFVRIADGRREEEVPLTKEVCLDYLPDEQRSKYLNVRGSRKQLSDFVPKDTDQNEYEEKLARQFNELLHNLLHKNKAKWG